MARSNNVADDMLHSFLLGIPIVVLSIVFLFVTMKGYVASTIFKTHSTKNVAVISRIDAKPSTSTSESFKFDYSVTVQYMVKGVHYEQKLNYYQSNFYVGKQIEIYVDNNSPNKIMGANEGGVIFIFIVMNLIFLIVGIAFVRDAIKLSKDLYMLRRR